MSPWWEANQLLLQALSSAVFHPPCFEVTCEALPCFTLCPGRTRSWQATLGRWEHGKAVLPLSPSAARGGCAHPPSVAAQRHWCYVMCSTMGVCFPFGVFPVELAETGESISLFYQTGLKPSLSLQSLPSYRSFVGWCSRRDKASLLRSALLPPNSAMATGCGVLCFTEGRIIHNWVYFNHVKDS